MVGWRGVSLDDRTAAAMDEVVRLCPGFHIDPSQGSWSGAAASAGTHSGCGAIDITNLSASQFDELVFQMRKVGFAAWHRTPEQSDWIRHAHGILVQPGGKGDRGCLHASAHDQVVDYYENRNGLASNARDDATREFVGVTWEQYLAEQDVEPEPEDEQEEDVKPWIAQDDSGIALVWIDPGKGEIVWENVGIADAVSGWVAAGVPGPIRVSDIGVLGMQVGRGVG